MSRLFFGLVLLLVALGLKGQQIPNNNSPCPQGMIPGYGGCYSPTDPDRFDDAPDAIVRPNGFWENRFGAIADSSSGNGSIGVAQNKKSAREAREKALSLCEGNGCKIILVVRNSCVAIVDGDDGAGYGQNPDEDVAEFLAANNCKDAGYKNCKLRYKGCSNAVRIR